MSDEISQSKHRKRGMWTDEEVGMQMEVRRLKNALDKLDQKLEERLATHFGYREVTEDRKRETMAARDKVERLIVLLDHVSAPSLRYPYNSGSSNSCYFYQSSEEQKLVSEELQRQFSYDPTLRHLCEIIALTEPLLNLGHLRFATPAGSESESDSDPDQNHEVQAMLNSKPRKSMGSNNYATDRIGELVVEYDPTPIRDDFFSDFLEQDGPRGLRYWCDRANLDMRKPVLEAMQIPEHTVADPSTSKDALEYELRQYCLDVVAALVSLGSRKVSVIPHLTSDGMSSTRGTDHAGGMMSADLVLALMEEADPTKCQCALVPCDVKGISMMDLIAVMKWSHFWRFGTDEEEHEANDMPTAAQFKRENTILKQFVAECMLYTVDVVTVWDGQQLNIFKFDFEDAHRCGRKKEMCEEEEKRVSLFLKENPPETFAVVKCQTAVISFSDYNPSVRFALTALVWRQLLDVADGTFGQKCEKLRQDSSRLFMSDEEWNVFQQQKKRYNDKCHPENKGTDAHFQSTIRPEPSFIGRSVSELQYEPIQDSSEYVNRVVRLTRQQYMWLFPQIDPPSIVLKVLDYDNLQEYLGAHMYDEEMEGVSYRRLQKWCKQNYEREVYVYRMIERFNATASCKIHAPRLLDYGWCNLTDRNEERRHITGEFLMLEDLAAGRPLTSRLDADVYKRKLDEQVELMAQAGFVHMDLARRNVLEVDGELYIIDFSDVRFIDLAESKSGANE